VFGDLLKMVVAGIQPHAVMNGDRGDENIEPRDGEPFATKPPCESDGAVPIVLAAGTLGDHGKMRSQARPFLDAGTAEHFQPDR
jgi:hypothetical protein